MPGFTKGPNFRTPFGNNNYLGSTVGIKYEGRTVAKSAVPVVVVDATDQKPLMKGAVMAKITEVGPDLDKIGPRDADATDGRQTVANIVGICNTFLPWQFLERDVEVAVVYDATVVQDNCWEYDGSAEEWVPMTNTTVAAIKPGGAAGLAITLRTPSSEL